MYLSVLYRIKHYIYVYLNFVIFKLNLVLYKYNMVEKLGLIYVVFNMYVHTTIFLYATFNKTLYIFDKTAVRENAHFWQKNDKIKKAGSYFHIHLRS